MGSSPLYEQTQDTLYVELQQGTYWKAKQDSESDGCYYVAGDALLLESIRDVDGQAHTILLRAHPRWYAANPRGDVELRFLVQDFLSKFDPCPDYKRIRNAELLAIQGHVQELQKELSDGQMNPEVVMKESVDAGMREWEEKHKLLPGAADTLPEAAPTAVLDSTLTVSKVETMKLSMAKRHEVATLQANWLTGKTEEITETLNSMAPFYKEQAAAALAMTEDVMAHVKKLQKGIESLDLYVGSNVEIHNIKIGKDADPELPLTIMQSKLYMDEELSAWADVDSKFDFTNQELFFKTLKKEPSLVKQIFPTERCIVCMATRRHDRYYENAYENAEKNDINKQVFLLVRNGDNLNVVWSPVESHLRSPRLFPSQKDIDDIFKERGWGSYGEDYREITFQNVKYTDKLTIAEAHSLHYKRFLILLAGLDHNKNLFGTFYNEPKGMNFISMKFQQKYMNFVHDDEGSGKMLPLEDRPDFGTWLKDKNAGLRSGSRVIALWDDIMDSDTAPGAVRYNWRDRNDNERWIVKLKEDYSIAVAFRMGKNLYVKAPVKGDSWAKSADEQREFGANVNLTKFDGKSSSKYGYICLDAVKSEELEWYIYDRSNRKDYLSYVRLFKYAVAYLKEQEKFEAPIRKKLKEAIETGSIASGAKADQIVDKTVITWRAAHRGESLPTNSADLVQLYDQMYAVAKAEKGDEWQKVETWAKERGLTPLRLVLSGKSTMSLYVAPDQEDNRLWPHAWVINIVLLPRKEGYKEYIRRSRFLPVANAAEQTLHEWPAAEKWAGLKGPLDKLEDKIAIFEACHAYETRNDLIRPQISAVLWDRYFDEWRMLRRQMNDRHRGMVQNPCVHIPLGVHYNSEKKKVSVICVGHQDAAVLLHRTAPDETRRKQIEESYVSIYKMKQSNLDGLREAAKSGEVHLMDWPVRSANDLPPESGITEESAGRLCNGVKLTKLNTELLQIIKDKVKSGGHWTDDNGKNKQAVERFWIPNLHETE